MNIQHRSCANCAHFRHAHGFVPHKCVMENLEHIVEDGLCTEHQTKFEADQSRAEAIARGAILRARGSQ